MGVLQLLEAGCGLLWLELGSTGAAVRSGSRMMRRRVRVRMIPTERTQQTLS